MKRRRVFILNTREEEKIKEFEDMLNNEQSNYKIENATHSSSYEIVYILSCDCSEGEDNVDVF